MIYSRGIDDVIKVGFSWEFFFF